MATDKEQELPRLQVPPSLHPIARILNVADQIDKENAHVAYLCRQYALEKANNMDPTSVGRGVRQFKTSLLRQLETDEGRFESARKGKSDQQEMREFYQKYYEKYSENVKKHDVDRAQLTNAYHTAGVLFEVLVAVTNNEVPEKIRKTEKDLKEKEETFAPYNILPLDSDDTSHPLRQLEEVKAALDALRDDRGLPVLSQEGSRETGKRDLLDWLGETFGFQKDNVANQKEHLILLLANVQSGLEPAPKSLDELDDRAIDRVYHKLFKNYKTWCSFLGKEPSLELPEVTRDKRQKKLIYMALFLLIWGEAANLRFMPECLCYVYHHMALEVHELLVGVSISPPYDGQKDSFLDRVVTPIYNTVKKEADTNSDGKAPHSSWRNYDDMNEYFWSRKCFKLGWPMETEKDFFKPSDTYRFFDLTPRKKANGKKPRHLNKTGFVEIRSFWHLYRSFDRMWTFLILCLQAMVIMAWNGSQRPSAIFKTAVSKGVLSIFMTAAGLRFLQAFLDVIFHMKAYRSLSCLFMLRLLLKLLAALFWVIILPVCYLHPWKDPSGLGHSIEGWFGLSLTFPSLYIVAVVFYLLPDMLGLAFSMFPRLRRWAESSDNKIIRLFLWWSQPRLFLGRGMHENLFTLFKYVLFWLMLLASKMIFSYYIEIIPLIQPTKAILRTKNVQWQWHEFFPHAKRSIGAIVALWAPIILVYFMDIQIWYAVFSTIFGGVTGAFMHLGEIRTISMLRSRFHSVAASFNSRMVPYEKPFQKRSFTGYIKKPVNKQRKTEEKMHMAKFAPIWNEIIYSLREEDLIDNGERDVMLVPASPASDSFPIQWPGFLLQSKVPMAVQIAKQSNMEEIWQTIESDKYMFAAVQECYELMKLVLKRIIQGELEKEIIHVLDKVDKSIANHELLKEFKMTALPALYDHFEELIKHLIPGDSPTDPRTVVLLLQGMLEVVTCDMMVKGTDCKEVASSHQDIQRPDTEASQARDKQKSNDPIEQGQRKSQLFTMTGPTPAVIIPPHNDQTWLDQLKRLRLLLTKKDAPMDVPTNLEARKRISFFANSVFMEMPSAPFVRKMMSFSVLTPYVDEEVIFPMKSLDEKNEDGISILFYLQKIFPDEWKNLLQRTKKPSVMEIRSWASYRGQTLSRTVRGMMYYKRALELQAVLDMATANDKERGSNVAGSSSTERNNESHKALRARAFVDLKFTYVATCQKYGIQKRDNLDRAHDIFYLMQSYPSLRVAYVDEDEKTGKEYYSVLLKVVDNEEQEIYRIKLPGPMILGEGKPENQNHAIIFTRGEALQTIDMNQDNYLEEAMKMRNLLQEFNAEHAGRRPSILGVRENIFTGSVSSLAWFMSNQETTFVTIGQRVLANPLKVRFHYGHPDIFDRIFHITRGGISKASKVINLSEDIFAGFNSILRRGNVTHHEYIQVGKGRDVGLNQISSFEAKVANGNAEQTLSRDLYRLGHRFDFFRMMSCYITTVGFYFNTMLVVLVVYVFLYGRLYMALSGLESFLIAQATLESDVSLRALQAALASQSFVQFGLLMTLPMVMEIALERGFRVAISDFVVMKLQLATVFFTFSLGTKTHYYGRTILHGGAKYRKTGRGFVVRHEKFAENYRLYSRSHFIKGFEIMMLLIVYIVYGGPHTHAVSYVLITFSMWFLVGTWLFAPFVFNPSGFEWQKIVEDYDDWNKWIYSKGTIGVLAEQSWEAWWTEEQEHLKFTGLRGRILEVLLSMRFFIYQYGVVYHLHVTKQHKQISIYGLSWLVIVVVFAIVKILSVGRQKFKKDVQLMFRLLKVLLFIGFVSIILVLFLFVRLTVWDLFASVLAFVPTGWGLLQIALVCRSLVSHIGMWDSVRALARTYEFFMGLVLILPVGLLAWFPFVSEIQTRLLFNQAFSRGLQISRILAGNKRQDED